MRTILSGLMVLAIGASGWAGPTLAAWAQAHWEDLKSNDPVRVAARFAQDGMLSFLGSPWNGFYRGKEAVEKVWAELFSTLPLLEVRAPAEPRLIPQAGLAYGALTLLTPEGEIVLNNYLRFRETGEIAAADYVVMRGLTPAGPVVDGRMEPEEYLLTLSDQPTGMTFAWRNGAVVLHAALVSKGTGYVCVGFNTSPGKPGANLLLFAVLPDGTVVYEDHLGVTRVAHRRDMREDILETAGTLFPNSTIVEFVIPLDSADPEDVALVPGRTYWVLLAYHASQRSFTVRHTAWGLVQIALAP